MVAVGGAPFLFARKRRITTLICCVTTEDIMERLRKVKYPGFSRDIVSFGLVKSVAFEDGVARVSLAIATNDPKVPKQLKDDVEAALRSLEGVRQAVVELSVQAARAPASSGPSPSRPEREASARAPSRSTSPAPSPRCSRPAGGPAASASWTSTSTGRASPS